MLFRGAFGDDVHCELYGRVNAVYQINQSLFVAKFLICKTKKMVTDQSDDFLYTEVLLTKTCDKYIIGQSKILSTDLLAKYFMGDI